MVIQVITDIIIMGHIDTIIIHIIDTDITMVIIGDICLEYAQVEGMYLDSHAMVLYVPQTTDDIMEPTAEQPVLDLEVIIVLVLDVIQAHVHVAKDTV